MIITEDAMQDLNEMLDLTISTVSQALEAFEKMDDELADAVMAKEKRN